MISYNDLRAKGWTVGAASTDALATTAVRVRGWILTAGATASVLTIHNSAATDNAEFIVRAPINTTTVAIIPDGGVHFANGLFVDDTSGSPETTAVFYHLEAT